MAWLIAAGGAIALGALVWWSSGRAKPLTRRSARGPGLDAGTDAARLEIHRRNDGNLGPPM